MASRRRRSSKSWSVRLRRVLIEHRFNAAEGLVGVLALVLGLWLLWPAPDDAAVDHRGRWQQSLAEARQSTIIEADPTRGGAPIAVAKASVSVSAKREVAGLFGAPEGSLRRPRLARIADSVIPEIAAAEAAREDELRIARLPDARLPEPVTRPGSPGTGRSTAPGADGLPRWLQLAAVPPRAYDRPMIAVVIDDLGMNRRNTAALNDLKGPLTLAFLPYAGDLARQTRAARAAGHELLLHMPMEPIGQEWPGPDALLTSLEPEEFHRRLLAGFESFTGFVGMNNHMGSRVTADQERMAVVMAELGKRDLLFLDSMTTARSVGSVEARRHGVPFARRDVFIDTVFARETPERVLHQLAQVESISRERGAAVAIGHPHDATIEALRHWLPTLEARGFALVPISTIVARQTCRQEIMVAACGSIRAAGADDPPAVEEAAARQG